jgi:hypothetical protein
MKHQLRKIHLLTGWLFVLAFVLTGQYLSFVIHPLLEQSDRLRFSLRANHVYLLLLALVHLCLGAYLRISATTWRARLQSGGSLLLLAAAALTLAAFFGENKAALERPILLFAMLAAATGVGLHLLGSRKEKPFS